MPAKTVQLGWKKLYKKMAMNTYIVRILFLIMIPVFVSGCFDDEFYQIVTDENNRFRSHTVNFPLSDTIVGNYTDNSDGTVTDNATGLTWTKCTLSEEGTIATDASCSLSPAEFNWYDSKELCESLNLAEKNWRLPTMPELYSLVMYHSSGAAYNGDQSLNTVDFAPSFDDSVFVDTMYNIPPYTSMDTVIDDAGYTLFWESKLYWTSSLQKNNAENTTAAFYINFFNGFVNLRGIELNELFGVYETNYVRCISR